VRTIAAVAGEPVRLATGAELRVTGDVRDRAVVCLNGGRAEPLPGTWGASIEWLVRRLAPRFPGLVFAEVRYRVRSWTQFERCVADARAAVSQVGAARTLLLGYSMGGAVAIAAADEPSVEAVLALAPWIPDELDVSKLQGKRLDVLHGSFDRPLPGIPGVSPAGSRRGFDRARALGVDGSYELIRGALHAVAIRPGGRLVPLPRAGAWLERTALRVERWRLAEASPHQTMS
jgi:pimeloyl-ACP methyl ester carboxylesterase